MRWRAGPGAGRALVPGDLNDAAAVEISGLDSTGLEPGSGIEPLPMYQGRVAVASVRRVFRNP